MARDLDVRNLSSLAERIRTSIANHPFSVGDGQFVRATCSIGYACYPFIPGDLESLTWEQVLSVSDRALYMAKHSGRNAWVGLEATPESDGDIVLSRLRDDLHGLADDGQIKVHTSLAVDQRPIAWDQEDK